ncbi:hypothetical protein MUK42_25561 [Musa troglodytarum]|uniref:Uncharacterized protein n=1 Tax=Musa troglodytarum TaxID=320322 RepID=A0A9E7EJV7_9LILI|nr:hypothetical protein MUK42_25561 [Musa troglodytarum]
MCCRADEPWTQQPQEIKCTMHGRRQGHGGRHYPAHQSEKAEKLTFGDRTSRSTSPTVDHPLPIQAHRCPNPVILDLNLDALYEADRRGKTWWQPRLHRRNRSPNLEFEEDHCQTEGAKEGDRESMPASYPSLFLHWPNAVSPPTRRRSSSAFGLGCF